MPSWSSCARVEHRGVYGDDLDDRPEDIAGNMCEIIKDFEPYFEKKHLLVPWIQEWQVEQRIKRGGSQ